MIDNLRNWFDAVKLNSNDNRKKRISTPVRARARGPQPDIKIEALAQLGRLIPRAQEFMPASSDA